MPSQSKAIAFDLNQANLVCLRKALPRCEIEVVHGATAASLTRDWDPGTVDLLIVEAHGEPEATLQLCRFLASSGVLARESLEATDSQEELPKVLGLRRSRHNRMRRPSTPVLVLVPPGREGMIKAVLEAGARNCLVMPIDAKEVASMLVRAQEGNQPGRHTLNLEKAQTEDRWQDDGGEG